jgi:hypothetical protein
MRRTFEVSVELPPDVDLATMAHYIKKAIDNWTGGMDPEHPLGCQDLNATVRYRISGMLYEVK